MWAKTLHSSALHLRDVNKQQAVSKQIFVSRGLKRLPSLKKGGKIKRKAGSFFLFIKIGKYTHSLLLLIAAVTDPEQ